MAEEANPIALNSEQLEQVNAEIEAKRRGTPSTDEVPGAQAEPEPGFFSRFATGFDIGVEQDWVGSALADGASEDDPDPDYRTSKQEWERATSEVPSEYYHELTEARSSAQLWNAVDRIKKEVKLSEKMAESGWSGLTGRLTANLLDPTALAAAAATEGAAAPYVLSAKVGRMTRAVRSALVAGGTEAGLEASTLPSRPTKDFHDVLYTGLGAGALGAGFGALARPIGRSREDREFARAVTSAQDEVEAQQAAEDIRRVSDEVRSQRLTDLDSQIESVRGNVERSDEQIESLQRVRDLNRQQADEARATREAESQNARDAFLRGAGVRNDAGDDVEALARSLDDPRVRGEARTFDIGEPPARTAKSQDIERIDKSSGGRTKIISRSVPTSEAERETARAFARDILDRVPGQRRPAYNKAANDEARATAKADDADQRLKQATREREQQAGQLERLQRRRRETAQSGPEELVPEAVSEFRRTTGSNATFARGSTAGAQARTEGNDVEPLVEPESVVRPQEATEQARDITAIPGYQRLDVFNALLRSPNADVRHLTKTLFSDPIGPPKGSGRTAEISAAEDATRFMEARLARGVQGADQAWKDYVSNHLSGSWVRNKLDQFNDDKRAEFMTKVSRYIHTGDNEGIEEVARAGDAIAEQFRESLRRAKAEGVSGFENVPEDLSYLPRVPDLDKMGSLYEDGYISQADLRGLIAKSLREHPDNEGMDPELADRLANAWVRRFTNKAYGVDMDMAQAFFGRDMDAVAAIARDVTDDDELVDRLLAEVEARNTSKKTSKKTDKPQEKSGDIGYSKGRLRLNMDSKVRVDPPNGGESFEMTPEDLLVMDAEQLLGEYVKRVEGETSLVKKMREQERLAFRQMQEDGDQPKFDPERPMNAMREWQRWKKQLQASGNVSQKHIDYLEAGIRMIQGKPPVENMNTAGHQVMRFIKDLNFVVHMGQVGVAAVAEVGNVVTQAGWRQAVNHIPKIKDVMGRDMRGRSLEPMMEEIEGSDLVMGNEHILYRKKHSIDDFGLRATGRFRQNLEGKLEKTKQGVGFMSGLRPITNGLARINTIGLAKRVARLADDLEPDENGFRTTSLSDSDIERFRNAGMSPERLERVLESVKQNGEKVRGGSGRDYRMLGLDKWEVEDREALMGMIHKMTHRAVQRNMTGELPAVMHTEMGQMVLQYRSFVVNAFQKNLQHGINMRDLHAAHAAMFSTTFAGMAYVGQQYLNSFGQEDRDEFLERRLSPEEIAKSAFQRSTFASLTPTIFDTMNAYLPVHDGPVFRYGRTTGLATQFIEGIPSYSTVNNISRALSLPGNMAMRDDYQLSQKDVRALQGITPFGNMYGVRNVFNSMESDLPRASTPEERNPFSN